MTTPTHEQLCALASAVTGYQHAVYNGQVIWSGSVFNTPWNPKFYSEDWQQAQALQVVVWAANKIRHDLHRNPNILHGLFIGMLAENDTALLLSLGVELLEK